MLLLKEYYFLANKSLISFNNSNCGSTAGPASSSAFLNLLVAVFIALINNVPPNLKIQASYPTYSDTFLLVV